MEDKKMAVKELFAVGMRFTSFEEIKKRMSEYEKLVQQKFSKKHSKTMQACKLAGPYNEKLIYYEIHYICKCGGNFKSKGRGVRICRSNKTNCEAELKLRALGRQYLTVIKFNDKHNHPPMLELILNDIYQEQNGSDQDPVEKMKQMEEVLIKIEPETEHLNSRSRSESPASDNVDMEGNKYLQDTEVNLVTMDDTETSFVMSNGMSDSETNNTVQSQLQVMQQQLQQIQDKQEKYEQKLKDQNKLMKHLRYRIKQQQKIINKQQNELQHIRQYFPVEAVSSNDVCIKETNIYNNN